MRDAHPLVSIELSPPSSYPPLPLSSLLAPHSCITEAQKYQGHLYQAKEKTNKGEAKQQQWLEAVGSLHTDKPKLKQYLQQVGRGVDVEKDEGGAGGR